MKTTKRALEDLITDFGRNDIAEVLKDKIVDLKAEVDRLQASYDKKMAYIEARTYPVSWHKGHYQLMVELHTGTPLKKAKDLLERYSREYLTTTNKLPDNGLTDYQIQKAREHPVLDLIQDNTRLRRVGGRAITLCPFHHEKTPSFTIYPDNSWHCFGGCGAHGNNAIDFVIQKDKLTFREAVESL